MRWDLCFSFHIVSRCRTRINEFWISKKRQRSWLLPFAQSVQVLQQNFAAVHTHIFLVEENPGILVLLVNEYIPYWAQAWKGEMYKLYTYHNIKLGAFDECNKLWKFFTRHQVTGMTFKYALYRSNMRTLLFERRAASESRYTNKNWSEGSCITLEYQK